jgi:hypothetical protein
MDLASAHSFLLQEYINIGIPHLELSHRGKCLPSIPPLPSTPSPRQYKRSLSISAVSAGATNRNKRTAM